MERRGRRVRLDSGPRSYLRKREDEGMRVREGGRREVVLEVGWGEVGEVASLREGSGVSGDSAVGERRG